MGAPMARVLMAPDPWGTYHPVAVSANTDEAIQWAMDAFVKVALGDADLWGHLHERLRDPEGFMQRQQQEHEARMKARGGMWVSTIPSIGIYYTVEPLFGALASVRDARQKQVSDWCADAFGVEHATSIQQRGIRFLEEAIEAYQATGGDRAMAHKLVDFIFDKPTGDLFQELGGVGVTLLALAAAAGLSADGAEHAEVTRVLSKPIEHFRARNAAKDAAGFNVVSPCRSGYRTPEDFKRLICSEPPAPFEDISIDAEGDEGADV